MVENRKGRTSVQKLLIAVTNILYTPEYHMTAVLVDQESSGIWHITAFQQQKELGWQILQDVRWVFVGQSAQCLDKVLGLCYVHGLFRRIPAYLCPATLSV